MRDLFNYVVVPTLLYGVVCWASALRHDKYQNMIFKVQRIGNLMSTKCLSTTSSNALCVLAKTMPMHLVEQRAANALVSQLKTCAIESRLRIGRTIDLQRIILKHPSSKPLLDEFENLNQHTL